MRRWQTEYIRVTVKREVKLGKGIKSVNRPVGCIAKSWISKKLSLVARERTPILTSSNCVLERRFRLAINLPHQEFSLLTSQIWIIFGGWKVLCICNRIAVPLVLQHKLTVDESESQKGAIPLILAMEQKSSYCKFNFFDWPRRIRFVNLSSSVSLPAIDLHKIQSTSLHLPVFDFSFVNKRTLTLRSAYFFEPLRFQ